MRKKGDGKKKENIIFERGGGWETRVQKKKEYDRQRSMIFNGLAGALADRRTWNSPNGTAYNACNRC